MIRVDAFGLLPSILIVLMTILAILGVVAHAAALYPEHDPALTPGGLRVTRTPWPRLGRPSDPGPPRVRGVAREVGSAGGPSWPAVRQVRAM